MEVLKNMFSGSDRVLVALNSPACDTYMTLLKMLMKSAHVSSIKANKSSMSAQMRNQLKLQDIAIDLFTYMFELRRPPIIKDLQALGASATLLKE